MIQRHCDEPTGGRMRNLTLRPSWGSSLYPLLICAAVLSGCAASPAGPDGIRTEQSIPNTSPPSEPESTSPPAEPTSSPGPNSHSSTPSHTPTESTPAEPQSYAIDFGSPVIPGGGSAAAPRSYIFKNEYKYAATVRVTVSPSPWGVTNNTCGQLKPNAECTFTVVHKNPTTAPVTGTEIFEEVTSTCTDKKADPCSLLPSKATPTVDHPVLAVWRNWAGRLVSSNKDLDLDPPTSEKPETTSPSGPPSRTTTVSNDLPTSTLPETRRSQ